MTKLAHVILCQLVAAIWIAAIWVLYCTPACTHPIEHLIAAPIAVLIPAAVVLKACRACMDTKTKKEHIDKWGGMHAITEVVYDCADLAQRILDAGLAMESMCAKPASSRQMILIDDLRRSLDMDDGDVEATVDPDTGEID